MRNALAIAAALLVVSCLPAAGATTTWLWDDFNGTYPGGFNGFLEEHFRVGDFFATHYYDADSAHSLAPHTGRDAAQSFIYFKWQTDNAFVTYFETKSYTDPDSYMIDLVGLMALRGQDPIDLTQPITYRVRVYGHNDAYNPNDPAAYWRQMLEVQRPSVKKADIYWTGANNDTWQTLEITQTGLESNRYQWITFDSWYPGLDSEVDPRNYGDLIVNASFMNWENLEIEYTPVPPVFTNMIVVADPTDLPGYFHVENESRTFGMRCRYMSGATAVPHRGDRVTLWGSYDRLQPERLLRATTIKVHSSGNPVPRPLGMTTRSAGGRPEVLVAHGPSNVGVLARICGRITYVGSNHVWIDDGSKMPYGSYLGVTGMKVYTTKTGLQVNQRVIATGMIGLEYYTSGKMPVMQTRNVQDLQVLQ